MVLDYEKRGKANRCAAVSTKPCHRHFRQGPTCGYVDHREMIETLHR